jgi:predicted ArsR family transcriptional regulator
MFMSMTTARQKVIEYLGRRSIASADEIAHALKVSPATIRYHLRILIDEKRVEVVGRSDVIRRGRPERLFTLKRGENLAVLSDKALSVWMDGLTETEREAAMKKLGSNLAGAPNATRLPIQQRLAALVERLNKMNYEAHWEAGATGPRVILGQCPYAAIVDGHPELCQMDAALLGEILGTPVRQTAKLEGGLESSQGLPFCAFAVVGG